MGWTGMLAAVITWSLLIWIHPGRIWSLILFVPATLSAMGFIQGQLHFCAGFGLTHLYNFGPGAGTADTVLQAEFRKQDRRKAVQIIAYSLAAGAGISLIAFLSTENR